MANYSRQREAVLQVLSGTKSHPDAAWVYEQARRIIPNISLGTVYRNLSNLQKNGKIVCLGVYAGVERFDADVSEHLHFFCKSCHAMVDVSATGLIPYKAVEKELGAEIQSAVCVFEGICSDCKKVK